MQVPDSKPSDLPSQHISQRQGTLSAVFLRIRGTEEPTPPVRYMGKEFFSANCCYKRVQPKEKKNVIVVVNFICRFGWATVPRYLIKHYSACFSEGMFKRLTLKSVDFG